MKLKHFTSTQVTHGPPVHHLKAYAMIVSVIHQIFSKMTFNISNLIAFVLKMFYASQPYLKYLIFSVFGFSVKKVGVW